MDAVNFEDLAKFLVQEKITNERDISNYGQLVLANKVTDSEISALFH